MAKDVAREKTLPMSSSPRDSLFDLPLARAHDHALAWLESLDDRPVSARSDADAVTTGLGQTLPEGPTPAEEVVDLLAAACDPGLVAMPSGRFFGFVIGGAQPAALAADWLVSA